MAPSADPTDPLAGKSEAEIRRLMWKAAAKRGDALWVVPLLLSIIVGIAALLVGWQVMRIANAALAGSGGAGAGASAAAGAAAATPFGAPAAPSLPDPLRILLILTTIAAFGLSWIVCRRFMVVRTMRRLLNKVACPYCDFSIVGLRPRGAFVTCPECGERIDLFEHGLKPADLLTESEKRKPFKGAGKYGAYKPPPVGSKR